jgi:hypothetical protein
MHIRSGPHGHELNTAAVAEAEDRHRAFCSCGDWEHERLVDPGNPLDRAEFETAWFEHVNPGART